MNAAGRGRWRWTERGLLGLVLLFSALRLAAAPAFELFPQEAYYDLYARHLALSYFDHPPLIAWALAAFTALFGQHALTLRLCAFGLTTVTQVLLWTLVREAVPAARRPAALLFLITPALSVLSLISTPDVPLLLFWTATLLCAWRAVHRHGGYWLAAGLCAGLACDGKYTAAYLPVGIALWLGAAAPRQLRSPWLWGGALLGALATAPVIFWNATHGFASFRFQTVDRVAAAPGLQLRFLGGLLATQTALLGVALFVAVLWAVLWAALRAPRLWRAALGERRFAAVFFAVFSLPPLLGFLALSLFAQVKPNWLLAAYVAAVPFVALVLPAPERLIWPTLAWSVAVQLLGAVELVTAAVPIRSDDTCFGWGALATAVAPLRPAGGFVFAADGYKTSAELEFYGGGKVYAGNVLGLPGLQYDFLGDDLSALQGQDALFLDSDPASVDPGKAPAAPARLLSHFVTVEQLDPLLLPAHGRVLRKFYAWRCRGYRGP